MEEVAIPEFKTRCLILLERVRLWLSPISTCRRECCSCCIMSLPGAPKP